MYTITATNSGTAATSGGIAQVFDMLLSGLTPGSRDRPRVVLQASWLVMRHASLSLRAVVLRVCGRNMA